MAYKITYYCDIKDKYCICYYGFNTEYLIQLNLLIPFLEQHFSGLQIYLACQDTLLHLIKDNKNSFPKSWVSENKRFFGHVKQIQCNIGRSHPIEDFLLANDIKCPVIQTKSESNTTNCLIYNNSMMPNTELNSFQIENLKSYAKLKGFEVILNPKIKMLDKAGWVIGNEGDLLYLAAAKGIKTSLIPTGMGQMLFKSMFPNAEVFDITNLRPHA